MSAKAEATDQDLTAIGTNDAPRAGLPSPVSWASCRRHLIDNWNPGQHFAILAPTETGKTVFASQGLLPMWSHSITIDPKGDDNLDWARRLGAKVLPRYPKRNVGEAWGEDPYPDRHYWINPPLSTQYDALGDAMSKVWHGSTKGRGWVVYVDEVKMISDPPHKHGLGMESHIIRYLRYGRGRGITFIGGTQSPRFVTGDLYDQPRWHAIGYTSDRRTIDRYGEISGFDMSVARDVIPNLGEHEFWVLGPHRYSVVTSYPLNERRKTLRRRR